MSAIILAGFIVVFLVGLVLGYELRKNLKLFRVKDVNTKTSTIIIETMGKYPYTISSGDVLELRDK